jgi:hypothetical protein
MNKELQNPIPHPMPWSIRPDKDVLFGPDLFILVDADGRYIMAGPENIVRLIADATERVVEQQKTTDAMTDVSER